MAEKAVERDGCRFLAAPVADGKAAITMELFHDAVPTLEAASVATTLTQAKTLAEAMNERILGIVVLHS